jgi:hypothetical protein
MDSIYGKKISVINLIVPEKMEIYWKVVLYKVLQIYPTLSYLRCLYLQNGSHFWAEILGFFLTWLGLPTVKISAKSVTSIEQRSAGIGRGLGAMPHKMLTYYSYYVLATSVLV